MCFQDRDARSRHLLRPCGKPVGALCGCSGFVLGSSHPALLPLSLQATSPNFLSSQVETTTDSRPRPMLSKYRVIQCRLTDQRIARQNTDVHMRSNSIHEKVSSSMTVMQLPTTPTSKLGPSLSASPLEIAVFAHKRTVRHFEATQFLGLSMDSDQNSSRSWVNSELCWLGVQ